MRYGYAIYVADRSRNRVLRWNPDTGQAEVLAGQGSGGDRSQLLREPYGLAMGPSGELLVSDKMNDRICRLRNGRLEDVPMRDDDGHRVRRADSPAHFDAARLHSPTSFLIEKSGSLVCAFYDDHTIYRIHPSGRLELLLGIVPNQPYFHNAPRQSIGLKELSSAPIGCPTALVGRSDGTLFFVERLSQVVREFHPHRGLRSIFALSQMGEWFRKHQAPASGRTDGYHPVSPVTLALDADERLYLCDNCHGAVLQVNPEIGSFRRVLLHERSPQSLGESGPVGLAFGPDGTPWVANCDTQDIRAYSVGGDGTWSPGAACLSQVEGERLRFGGGGVGMVCGN